MKKRVISVVAATVLALGVSVGVAQPASAGYADGWTAAYVNSGYTGGLAKSWFWGSVGDCNSYPGFVFWSGAYAQARISSVNVGVGGRSHCNWLSVRAGTPDHPYGSKCISHNDSGIGGFPAAWNDNVDAIVLSFNPGCPLY